MCGFLKLKFSSRIPINFIWTSWIYFNNFNKLQDIQFKVQRHQQQIMYRTNIRHDCPWKLHQVQDAGNHLRQAILQIEKIDKETIFK